jgi:hypothetical protein
MMQEHFQVESDVTAHRRSTGMPALTFISTYRSTDMYVAQDYNLQTEINISNFCTLRPFLFLQTIHS